VKDELENFIANHRDELDNKQPDPAVLARILGQMQNEQKAGPKGVLITFRMLQWAAAFVIILGGCIIVWSVQKQTDNKLNTATAVMEHKVLTPKGDSSNEVASAPVAKLHIIKNSSVDSVDEAIALRRDELVTKLGASKAVRQKLALFASLKNMDSPASRINATSGIYQLKNAGKDVVDALVQTLNSDPNANVRMAALDGLAKFYREQYVRKKLVASLKKQQDPAVQIAMIELLTRMKESAILTELDELVNDDKTMTAVKDCAYSSIFRLRSS
jgi:hypothetical protein